MLQPHKKQEQVIRSPARFKGIRAGRRSGKTKVKAEIMLFKAVSKSIKLARQIKNRAVIFIAPTQKQARTIVWEEFRSRLGRVGEYNESRLEIKLPNEEGGYSTIFIGGWENRENYRGMPNVVHIEFDEVDTMRDFMVGWQEIFRPMLIDTGGSAGFGGTPKKENPNLRRLEKEYENDPTWEFFHFTTFDNPYVEESEIEAARQGMDVNTFREEILAEYVENEGALFKYSALLDMFTNTVTKDNQKYLLVDVADDGSDKTIFSYWNALEAYRFDTYNLQTDGIISQIRESAAQEKIPYSQIAVDAIGVGAGVASSPLLTGIVGFKSSYSPIKTDIDPVKLPNVHYRNNAPLTTDYKNLRSQCIFTLARLVNEHEIAITIQDQKLKSQIIEELAAYQDASKGDGKRLATMKEDIKAAIGRSPDITDTLLMRMFFLIKGKMLPDQSEEGARIRERIQSNFRHNENNMSLNSTE